MRLLTRSSPWERQAQVWLLELVEPAVPTTNGGCKELRPHLLVMHLSGQTERSVILSVSSLILACLVEDVLRPSIGVRVPRQRLRMWPAE